MRHFTNLLQLNKKNFVRYLNDEVTYAPSKTKAIILSKEENAPLVIKAVTTRGFRLSNDMHIIGPMALFPKSVLSWNLNSPSEINEDSLSLFYLLEPKLDIVVIGAGDMGFRINLGIVPFMKRKGISLEK